MKFKNSNADIFIPDNSDLQDALDKTTHLCIVAHQDDTEIAAYHGIAECYKREDRWFSSVIVTNGGGSPRKGKYADYTDEDMQKVRCMEQQKAAEAGGYAVQIQLGYPSSAVKDPGNKDTVDDIFQILDAMQPEVLYLHNPADKHDTHIATLLRTIEAVRRLPEERRPEKVLGCEVWRDLDWLQDSEKDALDVSAYPDLSASLLSVFDSQISGGKRYDLATAGRRLANATFFASHDTDDVAALTFAIDLTPLVKDTSLSIKKFALEAIERFRDDVTERLDRLG
jgi:LmbE family N-acetylglucosaminyl deacetylase